MSRLIKSVSSSIHNIFVTHWWNLKTEVSFANLEPQTCDDTSNMPSSTRIEVISPKESFIDLFEKPITFEKPPFDKFPCLGMGNYVIEKGGTMPAVFHGADTAAVKAFMDKTIEFTDIPKIIQKTMDAHRIIKNPDLDAILDSEKWAEEYAKTLVGKDD